MRIIYFAAGFLLAQIFYIAKVDISFIWQKLVEADTILAGIFALFAGAFVYWAKLKEIEDQNDEKKKYAEKVGIAYYSKLIELYQDAKSKIIVLSVSTDISLYPDNYDVLKEVELIDVSELQKVRYLSESFLDGICHLNILLVGNNADIKYIKKSIEEKKPIKSQDINGFILNLKEVIKTIDLINKNIRPAYWSMFVNMMEQLDQ
jgi:hypothetical protein